MSQPNSSTALPTRKALPRNVKVLGLASLVNDIASEMIYPLLPSFFLSTLGGTRALLGLIEGLAESVSSCLKLWSGAWSDRLRRRKILIIPGYALAAVARPAIAILSAPWQFLIVRSIDRVGKGIRSAPRDALIAASTPAEIRGHAFGFHRAMDHLGAAVGPVLASLFLLLWPGELRWLFAVTLVPGIAVVLLLAGLLKETAQPAAVRHEPFKLSLVPFTGNFKLFLAALLLFTWGNTSDAFLLVRAEEAGVAGKWLPLLWCVFHLAKSGGNWLAGFATDKLGPRRLILAGWIVYAGIYGCFAVASQAWQIWTLFLGYALFYALTEPAEKSFVALLVGKEHRGLAYGWFNFAVGITTLPANLLFGVLYQYYGAIAAFGWGSSISLCAAGVLLLVRTPHGSETKAK